MDQIDQINAFSRDVQSLVNRYADEFDISSAAMTGVLAMVIRLVQDEDISQWNENQHNEDQDPT